MSSLGLGELISKVITTRGMLKRNLVFKVNGVSANGQCERAVLGKSGPSEIDSIRNIAAVHPNADVHEPALELCQKVTKIYSVASCFSNGS